MRIFAVLLTLINLIIIVRKISPFPFKSTVFVKYVEAQIMQANAVFLFSYTAIFILSFFFNLFYKSCKRDTFLKQNLYQYAKSQLTSHTFYRTSDIKRISYSAYILNLASYFILCFPFIKRQDYSVSFPIHTLAIHRKLKLNLVLFISMRKDMKLYGNA